MFTQRIGYSIGLVVLVLSVLACSLSSESGAVPTTVPLLLITPSPTAATSMPTTTPQATATTASSGSGNSSSGSSGSTGSNTSNCTVRSDWLVYTVVAGDTLGKIAQRVGTTTSDLTRANCLANADSIRVGQQLRVPNLPPPTPTPKPNSQQTTSSIPVTFTAKTGDILRPEGTYQIRPNATVTISWSDLPADTIRTEFYYGIAGAESAVFIGADSTPSDGASVSWTLPSDLTGVVYALAMRPNDSWHTSASVNVTTSASLNGLVDIVDAQAGTIKLLVDQENTRITVNVSGATFRTQSGNNISINAIKTWTEVRATGFYGQLDDLTFNAKLITLLDIQPPMQTAPIQLDNVTITELSNERMIVVSNNTYVFIKNPVPSNDPNARVEDKDGNPLTLNDLKVGNTINITGFQWVGSYYATDIQILN